MFSALDQLTGKLITKTMRQPYLLFASCFTLFFCVCSAPFALGQTLDKTRIQFRYQEKPMDLVLLDLEIKYRIKFEYEPSEIKDVLVTAFSPKLPLPDALKILFKGTDIQFEFAEPRIVKLSLGAPEEQETIQAYSEQEPEQFNFTISGVIRDTDSGETLPFANVIVSGTVNGATTNVDGLFSIFNVPSDTVLLEIDYIGYRKQYFRLQPTMDMTDLEIRLSQGNQILTEIVVSASQKEQMISASKGISNIAVAPAQLASIPSLGEKDIFRSLQLLPGVSGSNESSSGLYVRGGTPDQNLVLFDGFTVYHVDHLFGFFSAFNSNAIKDVQLYKGGFESRYGGRLSSVVDITGKDGNTESINAGGGLSLMSVNGFAELPFAKGKGSFILTGRRSFQSNFYSNILERSDGDDNTGTEESDDEGTGGRLRQFANAEPNSWFYDLNAKATYRTEKDVFSLSFYNGKDNLDNSRNNNLNDLPLSQFGFDDLDFNFELDIIDKSDWGNTGSSLKWSRKWNNKWYSNALLSYSNYFSFRDRRNTTIIQQDTTTTERSGGTLEDNNLKDYAFKWDWEWKANNQHKIGFGVFGNAFDIAYDFTQNDTTTILSRDDQGLLGGAYAQIQSTLFDRLIVLPGIRASYFDQTQSVYWEPRIQVQYLASDRIKIKAAAGRYYQFANRVLREDINQGSRDFWILADGESVPVGKADHLIGGVAYETKNYLFDVEVYHKDLENLTEYSTRFALNGIGQTASLDFEENFFNGNGYAQGIEFLAQKKSGALTGWLSYTLGQVDYNFEVYGPDDFPAAHDVTHETKLVGMYKLGKWSFGGTFVYATGRPYTAPVGAYTVDLLDGESVSHFALSDKNVFRLPDYHRLDLSINYDFDYFLNGKATAGLSFFNVYGRQNVWYKEYDVVENVLLETDVNYLGFTPSLYFTWRMK